jgi:hypothetical protein
MQGIRVETGADSDLRMNVGMYFGWENKKRKQTGEKL